MSCFHQHLPQCELITDALSSLIPEKTIGFFLYFEAEIKQRKKKNRNRMKRSHAKLSVRKGVSEKHMIVRKQP